MRNYTLRFLPSSRDDLVRMKEYILKEFMYPQYGVNFYKKIKEATKIIKISVLRVLKDGMNWECLMKSWIHQNR